MNRRWRWRNVPIFFILFPIYLFHSCEYHGISGRRRLSIQQTDCLGAEWCTQQSNLRGNIRRRWCRTECTICAVFRKSLQWYGNVFSDRYPYSSIERRSSSACLFSLTQKKKTEKLLQRKNIASLFPPLVQAPLQGRRELQTLLPPLGPRRLQDPIHPPLPSIPAHSPFARALTLGNSLAPPLLYSGFASMIFFFASVLYQLFFLW